MDQTWWILPSPILASPSSPTQYIREQILPWPLAQGGFSDMDPTT